MTPPTLHEVTRGKQLSFRHRGGCIKAVGGKLKRLADAEASEEQLLFSFSLQSERRLSTATPTVDLLPLHVPLAGLLSFPDTD